jgi:Family of unknown function (DUF6502)
MPAGEAALKQAVYLFEPIIQLLLAHGVTYPQLVETLKAVFVTIALSSAASPARMTDSYVAITTGIHRKDVRRLRDAMLHRAASNPDGRQSLASTIFTRWLTDPQYCDEAGHPRRLLRQGEDPLSFETLVKSVSKDVHPRTVLNELIRLQLAHIDGNFVSLKVESYVPNADFAQLLDYLGSNLHDHAAAAVRNVLGADPPLLEQSVFSTAVKPSAISELLTLARDQWMQTVKRIVPEIARHEVEPPDGQELSLEETQTSRIRLGMYFYAEDQQPDAQRATAAAKNRSAK